jgi:hypothetical protein
VCHVTAAFLSRFSSFFDISSLHRTCDSILFSHIVSVDPLPQDLVLTYTATKQPSLHRPLQSHFLTLGHVAVL